MQGLGVLFWLVSPLAGNLLLRALGGDGGLQIISAQQQTLNLKRNLLQKIAGTGSHHTLASLDEQALKLPSSICYFESKIKHQHHLYQHLCSNSKQKNTFYNICNNSLLHVSRNRDHSMSRLVDTYHLRQNDY